MSSIQARITKCRPMRNDEGDDGYVLKWSAEDSDDWQEVLEAIKDLPYESRHYLPDIKCWWINESVIEEIWHLFSNADRYFTDSCYSNKEQSAKDNSEELTRLRQEVKDLYEAWKVSQAASLEKSALLAEARKEIARLKSSSGTANASAPKTTAQAFTELYLLPSAPLSVVKASFKTLAQIYHPDHGGNHQKMVALNAAYSLAMKFAQQHERKVS